jgi:hypothetical protein
MSIDVLVDCVFAKISLDDELVLRGMGHVAK